MRLFLLLALVALLSLAAGFAFREFNLGVSELAFIADFGFGGMTLFGSIMAVVVTVQLLYGEMEQRTILPVLAKPVGRSEFLIGKLLGAWLTLCCFAAVLSLSLAVALWARETQLMQAYPAEFAEGRKVDYSQLFVFGVLQTLRLAILSAAAAFFASYATSGLFAIAMAFFFWMIGQLQSVAAGSRGLSESGLLEGALWLVALAVPDLRLFDIGNELLAAEPVLAGEVARLALYALLYVALYGGLASAILSRREF